MKNNLFSSSIGQKIIMASTGILLLGFLIVHLLGNFLLFKSKDDYNLYSHALTSNPLIIIAQIGLLALFIIHIVMAIRVTLQNKKARPTKYAKDESLKESTLASKTMIHSGMILFIFLIVHFATFKFGKEIMIEMKDGETIRDIYTTVVSCFANKGYSIFYIMCMIVMTFHLSHGIKSAFQSLGLYHIRHQKNIKYMALAIAIIIGVSYSSFPIYFGFIKGE